MDKEKKEVSPSTDANGSVAAIAALIRKTLGFGQLRPGEAQASFSLLHQWIGEFLSLTPLDALAADI